MGFKLSTDELGRKGNRKEEKGSTDENSWPYSELKYYYFSPLQKSLAWFMMLSDHAASHGDI